MSSGKKNNFAKAKGTLVLLPVTNHINRTIPVHYILLLTTQLP